MGAPLISAPSTRNYAGFHARAMGVLIVLLQECTIHPVTTSMHETKWKSYLGKTGSR